jgi:catechol 2,3-dioxygenase-like lactoylglutathione lyase family enzyme
MARPSKFAHIVYRTRRFDEMIDWYEKVFEARVQHRNPALAFLTYDDEHHRFAFANLSVLDPAGGTGDGRADGGVDHVAYTYANLGDLLDTYARLKRQGIEPYWPIRHGPTLSLYYKDPDGNRMEFQVSGIDSRWVPRAQVSTRSAGRSGKANQPSTPAVIAWTQRSCGIDESVPGGAP